MMVNNSTNINKIKNRLPPKGAVVVVKNLTVQSVSITKKVVSSYPVHGKVYLIQFYVIKFVSDLLQVNGFLPPIKLTTMI